MCFTFWSRSPSQLAGRFQECFIDMLGKLWIRLNQSGVRDPDFKIARARVEPVKSEKLEVPVRAPVRQSSPSPAAVRMAAQAMAVVKPEATPVVAVAAVPSSDSTHLTPFPAVSMINHRGISLNGVPSYVPTGSWQPPLRVTRSWSGAIEPDLSNLASYRPVASVQLTPVAQPVAQVVTSTPVVLARRQISVGHLPQTQLTGDVEAMNTPMTPGTPTPCLG
eukprot:s563_g13.t1